MEEWPKKLLKIYKRRWIKIETGCIYILHQISILIPGWVKQENLNFLNDKLIQDMSDMCEIYYKYSKYFSYCCNKTH